MSKKQADKKTKVSKRLELASDITPEELQIFLQEADEQLQLLDEDIVKLEKGEEDSALLQEIFRAAHTLKGSSGMLGHPRMAQLTHAMESVLDRLRKGTMKASPPVVDALLASLDVLKVLKDEIITREISDVDIASVVTELEKVQQQAPQQTATPPAKQTAAPAAAPAAPPKEEAKDSTPQETTPASELSISDDDKKRVQQATAQGRKTFKVDVSVTPSAIDWSAIRCFQVLRDLSSKGEVITSSPSQSDIEAQKVGVDMTLLITTDQDEDTLREQISQTQDIGRVQLSPYVVEGVQSIAEEESHPADEETKDSDSKEKTQSHEAKTSQTVRIDVERLDDLMNMVGELAISHPRIHQITRVLEARYKEDEMVKALGETSTNAMKIVNELQEDIMKIRMLPIGTVFNTLPRMVRDLARKSNKDINFIVEGQDTEIDRTVIDHVRDPLVHLLRNAVDHGIESSEERAAAGKPQQGTIRLAAWHEEGHIIIITEDDGGGIEPTRVIESAVKKGMISAEAAAKLSDEEGVELIFLPGLSTAKKTTEVSGRGVGLDVVRKNIEAMNGVVLVDTKVGQGTKFTLRMPLTLATFHGLLVSSANTIYAIPLVSVTETVKLAALETRAVEGGEIMRLRNSIMPLIRLRRAFALDGDGEEGERFVIVMRDSTRSIGLAVDAVMEPQEVVVKSLGRFMSDIKGIAGASILGDGTVALIMDVPTLIRSTLGR